MAEDIAKKIKFIRCKLGELKKIVTSFSDVDQSLKDSEMYLNLRIKELDDDFQEIKRLHNELLSLGEETEEVFEKYQKENVFEIIQTLFFKHSTVLHELLKIVCLSDRHDLTFSEFSQAAFQRINMGTSSKPVSDSLTYLNGTIPSFDGTYDKWPEFKDLFISNVHENHHLNDSAKLRILQSVLKGDALKVIKREFVKLQSTDYEDVWAKLNKRYNHKKL